MTTNSNPTLDHLRMHSSLATAIMAAAAGLVASIAATPAGADTAVKLTSKSVLAKEPEIKGTPQTSNKLITAS